MPNLAVTMPGATADVKYPLRKQLIHWLLPARDDGSEISKSFCKTDPDWTAQALLTLTLRDPSASLKQCTINRQDFLSDLETGYLHTALEMPLYVQNVLYRTVDTQPDDDSVHIPTVLLVIENLVKTEVQYYCTRSEEQVCWDSLNYFQGKSI